MLIGPDLRSVVEVDEYLAWLTHNERCPNTVAAYAAGLEGGFAQQRSSPELCHCEFPAACASSNPADMRYRVMTCARA